jgi:hypothetical protein
MTIAHASTAQRSLEPPPAPASNRPMCSDDFLSVPRDDPVRYVCPADVRVHCLSGTAWITIEGDTRDIVLQAGQCHAASRRDRLFVNGLPRCELRIETTA